MVCEYMCVLLGGVYGLIAMSMAFNSALRIFWYVDNLYDI